MSGAPIPAAAVLGGMAPRVLPAAASLHPALTIGIKAYNEERHIAAAIASALAAAGPLGAEVILADCGSADHTVEIARRYPVRIVQLTDRARRSCGAGAQLAFQHARGDYFYLLDGDMLIDPDFLPAAIRFLESHPRVAGVGGRVEEVNRANEEFQIRAEATAAGAHWRAGTVDRLDCGGLYRCAAIREVGYLADANLHSFEEFELAARLAARGWTLARIDLPAVRHFGHCTGGYGLLWRRLRSGYAGGAGETLRAALGAPHFPLVIRRLAHVRNAAAVILWWLLLIALAPAPLALHAKLGAAALLLGLPLAFLAWRRGGLRLGLYSLATWNAGAAGLIGGALRRRRDPRTPLPSAEIATLLQAGPERRPMPHRPAPGTPSHPDAPAPALAVPAKDTPSWT
ncbi:glycosyltransferase [Roseomonas sp. E05]|uniref:glycosyltransferase family 2 protein n=1 Tax=Roseomonas sp. E05 TaxID=3046310 RepID=UPI0024BA60E4|nr:glycosyltransferase [Roseomonas sp. E05]MDJ0391468.1 glycosyltransferase [Roseomonas sp. E05]